MRKSYDHTTQFTNQIQTQNRTTNFNFMAWMILESKNDNGSQYGVGQSALKKAVKKQ